MTEYTPTTERIKKLVVDWLDVGGEIDGPTFDRWLAARDERVRAEEQGKFSDWLVQVLHYPFDMTFDAPPPVDIDAVADRWNEWDDWRVSADEARACVREEAGQ